MIIDMSMIIDSRMLLKTSMIIDDFNNKSSKKPSLGLLKASHNF